MEPQSGGINGRRAVTLRNKASHPARDPFLDSFISHAVPVNRAKAEFTPCPGIFRITLDTTFQESVLLGRRRMAAGQLSVIEFLKPIMPWTFLHPAFGNRGGLMCTIAFRHQINQLSSRCHGKWRLSHPVLRVLDRPQEVATHCVESNRGFPKQHTVPRCFKARQQTFRLLPLTHSSDKRNSKTQQLR